MMGTRALTSGSPDSHQVRVVPTRPGDGGAPRLFGLDLVRAIAIVCVMLAHFGGQSSQLLGFRLPTLVPMLGHGVELFFVLSGYLIGGLLLDIVERSPDRRSWFIFLIRRWMRTIPLYVVWVIVLLAFSPPWGSPVRYAIRYLTFMQNVFRPMPDWFPVSWSLASNCALAASA